MTNAGTDYYSAELGSPAIRTEITPTDHASRFRFTFPDNERAYLLFDSIDSVAGAITVDRNRRTVEGHVDHNGPRLEANGGAAETEVPVAPCTDSPISLACI